MPEGDPYFPMQWLLKQERELRVGGNLPNLTIAKVNPYWLDIARLLLVKHYLRQKKRKEAENLKSQMCSPVYDKFIEGRIAKITVKMAETEEPLLL